MDLICCLGNNPTFAQVAVDAGWKYGARLPGTTYHPVFFADQEYKQPDRCRYMQCLRQEQPVVATVLDWEAEGQLPEVLGWAEEAAQWCQRVVIIPKVPGCVGRLPRMIGGKPVILGYSVPTSYGGTTLGLWEFQGWPVHLLGGSPQKQMELSCYVNAVSADGNMAHQQAHKGRFWNRKRGPKGHWWQLSETGDVDTKDANLRAFQLSCKNILEAWQCQTMNSP